MKTDYCDPTVSVIIPTSGKRPELLARAINSAGAEGYDVEVIVVVNGREAENFQLPNHDFPGVVRLIRTSVPGANNARNMGLDAASGILTRFFDDDDFLIPEAARGQYEFALNSDATIVSSRIRVEDSHGNSYGESVFLDKDNLYCELLSGRVIYFTQVHVYKTSAIKSLRWDNAVNIAQDIDWLHRVVRDREQKWLIYDHVTVVWFQHPCNDRISSAFSNGRAMVVSAEAIIATYNVLKAENRLDENRKSATALGLWTCAHNAFPLAPFYWSKVIKLSITIDKDAITKSGWIYRLAAKWHIPVPFIEWIIIPKRCLRYFARVTLHFFRGTSYIRRI